MVAQGELTRKKSKAVNSEENSTEKKLRPQYSGCKFSQDGLSVNRASLFYGEVRQPEARVCSTFQRRDA